MRLPRFRLRTLMVAVAIAGLACGGVELMRRRSYCLERAAFHRHHTEYIEMFNHTPVENKFGKMMEYELYHMRMAEKYEYAARHPWLPVEPDPPAPE